MFEPFPRAVPWSMQPWRPSVEWMTRNRHSPLHLEQAPMTHSRAGRWRDEFEDLLRTEDGGSTNGKSTRQPSSNTQQPPSTITPESADTWLKRLVGEQLVRRRNNASFWDQSPLETIFQHQTGLPRAFHEDSTVYTGLYTASPSSQKAETELDMYEHFLSRETTSTSTSSFKQPLEAETKTKPIVIGTSTTTERRVLPDGTVSTRTVTKTRFADGTEDHKETSDETRPLRSLPGKSEINVMLPEEQNKNVSDGCVKKEQNWFWSGS